MSVDSGLGWGQGRSCAPVSDSSPVPYVSDRMSWVLGFPPSRWPHSLLEPIVVPQDPGYEVQCRMASPERRHFRSVWARRIPSCGGLTRKECGEVIGEDTTVVEVLPDF